MNEKIVRTLKKLLYPFGEPYLFAGKKLLFEANTRPIKREYLHNHSDVVRNDVLQINYFESQFKPSHVIWDIGSHHVHYSIFAASIANAAGQVFSFEPDDTARSVQNHNIKLNRFTKKIEVFGDV